MWKAHGVCTAISSVLLRSHAQLICIVLYKRVYGENTEDWQQKEHPEAKVSAIDRPSHHNIIHIITSCQENIWVFNLRIIDVPHFSKVYCLSLLRWLTMTKCSAKYMKVFRFFFLSDLYLKRFLYSNKNKNSLNHYLTMLNLVWDCTITMTEWTFSVRHTMEMQSGMNTVGDRAWPWGGKLYSSGRSKHGTGEEKNWEKGKKKESRWDNHVRKNSTREEETGLRAHWQGKAKEERGNQGKSCGERDSWGLEVMAADGVPEKSKRQKEETKSQKRRMKTGRCLMWKSCRRDNSQSNSGYRDTWHTSRQRERERDKTKTSVSFQEADDWLEEESQCSQHTHCHKNPQEDPVDDHGDVLPVILHLRKRREFCVCKYSKHKIS